MRRDSFTMPSIQTANSRLRGTRSGLVTRHTRTDPCPVCGGGQDDAKGKGIRCFGFRSDDARYCRCSREEHAGGLDPESKTGLFLHYLSGVCRCGVRHSDEEWRPPLEPRDDHQGLHRRVELARRIWTDAAPIAGTIAESYLRSRFIKVVPGPDELRIAARLLHKPTDQHFPALVAPLRNVGAQIVGIHRTFLAHDGSGKANVAPAKMMLGTASGTAIRFGAGPEIIITEGIENALACRQVLGLPTWAAGSLAGLRTVVLPESVRRVTIFADPKPHERRGAEDVARRLIQEGRDARVAYGSDDRDANEMLMGA